METFLLFIAQLVLLMSVLLIDSSPVLVFLNIGNVKSKAINVTILVYLSMSP